MSETEPAELFVPGPPENPELLAPDDVELLDLDIDGKTNWQVNHAESLIAEADRKLVPCDQHLFTFLDTTADPDDIAKYRAMLKLFGIHGVLDAYYDEQNMAVTQDGWKLTLRRSPSTTTLFQVVYEEKKNKEGEMFGRNNVRYLTRV